MTPKIRLTLYVRVSFFKLVVTCSCIVCCGKSAMIFRSSTNIANKIEFPIGNSAAMSYTRCCA